MSFTEPATSFPFVFGAYATHLNKDTSHQQAAKAGALSEADSLHESLVSLLGSSRMVASADGAAAAVNEPDRPPVIVCNGPVRGRAKSA